MIITMLRFNHEAGWVEKVTYSITKAGIIRFRVSESVHPDNRNIL